VKSSSLQRVVKRHSQSVERWSNVAHSDVAAALTNHLIAKPPQGANETISSYAAR
jgi:hypothetical protein